ncbi:MAG: hypothetical protein ACXABV_16235 [Candidatus Thorarchaeota archaeon]|jgi:hypothetical protein
MTEQSAEAFYAEQFGKGKTLSVFQLVLGFVISTLIMVGSTWGLIYVYDVLTDFTISPSNLGIYTLAMTIGSLVATIIGVIVCYVILKVPRSALVLLRVHEFFKRGTGEYFVWPEPKNQSLRLVFRRALYGSILVVGIGMTLVSFELMGVAQTADLAAFGTWVVIISAAVLPLTILILYYGPWLIKDAGLFHMDLRDRSLSNVGDDLEDMLEFFAGVDLVLVWLELTLTAGFEQPWFSVFVIMVALGPLFAIIFNFTLVFMFIKNRATLQVIDRLVDRYDTQDMFNASDSIRTKVLALIDRDILASLESSDDDVVASVEEEYDSIPIESDEAEEPVVTEEEDTVATEEEEDSWT